jgi:catechol 2,3-dioxygenase-like lactoylglutathione lyase family enzyme
MGIEINGLAHVILTVSDFAAARAFYGELLSQMGMTVVCDTDKFFYCVGGRTAIGIEPSAPEHRHERFLRARVGAAPSMPSRPVPRRCQRVRGYSKRHGRDYHLRPARRHMGARLLLHTVRGPGRHTPGSQPCAWNRCLRCRGGLQSRRRLQVSNLAAEMSRLRSQRVLRQRPR